MTRRRRGDTDGNAPPTAAGNGGIGHALLATAHLLVAALFAVAGWRWIPHDRPYAMTGAAVLFVVGMIWFLIFVAHRWFPAWLEQPDQQETPPST